MDLDVAVAAVAGVVVRGLLGQPRDQPRFGLPACPLQRGDLHPGVGGGRGERVVLQAGGADQLRFGSGDGALGDRAGQHEVRVPPRRRRLARVEALGGGQRPVQRVAHVQVPGAQRGAPQPPHHPRPGDVHLSQFGQEPGQHRGVDVAVVVGEPRAQRGGDGEQRGQRDTDTRDRPRAALVAGAGDQVHPHQVHRRQRQRGVQQQLAQLVQRHPPRGQAGEEPAVDRQRGGAGDQPLERRPHRVQRQGIGFERRVTEN
nr:hypothetical protein [Alloactinosynnema sp. L-07]